MQSFLAVMGLDERVLNIKDNRVLEQVYGRGKINIDSVSKIQVCCS